MNKPEGMEGLLVQFPNDIDTNPKYDTPQPFTEDVARGLQRLMDEDIDRLLADPKALRRACTLQPVVAELTCLTDPPPFVAFSAPDVLVFVGKMFNIALTLIQLERTRRAGKTREN